jgi:hypothetical protein
VQLAQGTTATVAPDLVLLVPPPAIAKMPNRPPVRTPAALAASLGPLKPDHGRQLRPIDRIEPAVLRTDRH